MSVNSVTSSQTSQNFFAKLNNSLHLKIFNYISPFGQTARQDIPLVCKKWNQLSNELLNAQLGSIKYLHIADAHQLAKMLNKRNPKSTPLTIFDILNKCSKLEVLNICGAKNISEKDLIILESDFPNITVIYEESQDTLLEELTLTNDALYKVFKKCSIPALLQCAQVCKTWNSLQQENSLWRKQQSSHFPHAAKTGNPKETVKFRSMIHSNFLKNTCSETKLGQHEDKIDSLGCIEGTKIISGSSDHTMKVWDLTNNEIVYTIEGISSTDKSIYVAETNLLICPSNDNQINIYDSKNGKLIHSLDGHGEQIETLNLFGSENKMLVALYQDGYVMIWDFDRRELQYRLETVEHKESTILHCDPSKLVSIAVDGQIKIRKLKKGQCKREFEIPTSYQALGLVHGKEQLLFPSTDDNKKLVVFNLRTEESIELPGHTGDIFTIISLPGNLVATGSQDNTIKIWNLDDKKCMHTLTGHDASIISLTLAGNNCLVSSDENGGLIVWDLKNTPSITYSLKGNDEPIMNTFSVDSQLMLLQTHRSSLLVWDLISNQFNKLEVDANQIFMIVDQRYIVVADSDNSMTVIDFAPKS